MDLFDHIYSPTLRVLSMLKYVFGVHVVLASCAPSVLLLSQFDRCGLGPDGNPVLVQRLDQNLPHVFVVRVEVEDISHHIGQTLAGKFLIKEQSGVGEKDK